MRADVLVRTIRREAGVSLRELAAAADVATSTVHRIEKGELNPTFDMLERLAEAAGVRLHLDAQVDYATSLVGLARFIAGTDAMQASPVRLAAELVARFRSVDADHQRRMIAGDPPSTGDPRWDAFMGALGEWLAVWAQIPTPPWCTRPGRFLAHGWWVTPLTSLRAWEYAGALASFKIRGVYIHRDSLTNT